MPGGGRSGITRAQSKVRRQLSGSFTARQEPRGEKVKVAFARDVTKVAAGQHYLLLHGTSREWRTRRKGRKIERTAADGTHHATSERFGARL